jgi:hypothetical protein
MNEHTAKIGLSVLETGWLLQKTESQVRGMLRRGELRYVVDGRKVDPESVEELIESGLARMLMRRLLAGLLVAPPPQRRWGEPADLFAAFDALMVAAPALVRDSRTGEVAMVPSLGPALVDSAGPEGTEPSLKPLLSFVM